MKKHCTPGPLTFTLNVAWVFLLYAGLVGGFIYGLYWII